MNEVEGDVWTTRSGEKAELWLAEDLPAAHQRTNQRLVSSCNGWIVYDHFKTNQSRLVCGATFDLSTTLYQDVQEIIMVANEWLSAILAMIVRYGY